MARTATRKTATVAAPASAAGQSYLEWSPVFAGGVLALAISAVLFQFGVTIGLTNAAPLRGEGLTAVLGVTAIGIWLLWVPLVSAAAGGYVAGFMRGRWPDATPAQVEMRDGVHGLTVWALATLGAAAGAALIGAIAALSAAESNATANLAANTSGLSKEAIRNAGVIYGFAIAAASVLSAGLAWWAATLGGDHRDQGIDVHQFVPAFLRN